MSRKAIDILLILIESQGQLVEKDDLMHRVWPDSFVEESNLAVHISQLRKTLGEGSGDCRIETIPRRGYRFVGAVEREAASQEPSAPVTQTLRSATLNRKAACLPPNPNCSQTRIRSQTAKPRSRRPQAASADWWTG